MSSVGGILALDDVRPDAVQVLHEDGEEGAKVSMSSYFPTLCSCAIDGVWEPRGQR